jgi:hypothetical protein
MSTEHIVVHMGLNKKPYQEGLKQASFDYMKFKSQMEQIGIAAGIGILAKSTFRFLADSYQEAVRLGKVTRDTIDATQEVADVWSEIKGTIGQAVGNVVRFFAGASNISAWERTLNAGVDAMESELRAKKWSRKMTEEAVEAETKRLGALSAIASVSASAAAEDQKRRFARLSDEEKLEVVTRSLESLKGSLENLDERSALAAKMRLELAKKTTEQADLELAIEERKSDVLHNQRLERDQETKARMDRGNMSLRDVASMPVYSQAGAWNRAAAQEVLNAREFGSVAKAHGAPRAFTDRVFAYSDRIANRVMGISADERNPTQTQNNLLMETRDSIRNIKRDGIPMPVIPVGNAP